MQSADSVSGTRRSSLPCRHRRFPHWPVYDILKEEGEEDILIAYGTVVGDIKEVSKSYKEAKLALDVGKIFFGASD